MLTPSQFEGLASGYGDAAALGALQAGQLTKRKLLLRAVADAVAGGGGEPRSRGASEVGAAILDRGLTLLAAVEDLRPAAVDAVLSHPHLDAWAASCLQRLRGSGAGTGTGTGGDGPPFDVRLGYLCALAAAAAVRAGMEFEIVVPAASGVVLLPTLGAAYGLAAADGDSVAVCGKRSGVAFVTAARTVSIAAPLDEPSPSWAPVRTLSVGCHGERLELQVEDLDPLRDCYRWRPADRLPDDRVRRLQVLLGEAWKLICQHHPAHALAIRSLLRSLVPLAHPSASAAVSATSRHAFGSVGMSQPPDGATMTLLLLHELQHTKLGGVLDLVDLNRPGGSACHHAPWRDDPRPVGALLQGAYAHLGVTDFWRVQRQLAAGARAALAQFEFAFWREQTTRATRTLASSGELTGLGERFVEQMLGSMAAWSRDAVPERIGAYARDLALERAVRWRLAHLRTSRDECAPLAAAWLCGAACPPVPLARVEAAPRPLPSRPSALDKLVRRSLTSPSKAVAVARQVDATAPEVAYLAGDHAAAAHGYRRQVERRPDLEQAWAGLALALTHCGPAAEAAAGALAARPELVRALFGQIRAASHRNCNVTPDGLAAWLASGLALHDRLEAGWWSDRW